jgi:hypothetical protein
MQSILSLYIRTLDYNFKKCTGECTGEVTGSLVQPVAQLVQ